MKRLKSITMWLKVYPVRSLLPIQAQFSSGWVPQDLIVVSLMSIFLQMVLRLVEPLVEKRKQVVDVRVVAIVGDNTADEAHGKNLRLLFTSLETKLYY